MGKLLAVWVRISAGYSGPGLPWVAGGLDGYNQQENHSLVALSVCEFGFGLVVMFGLFVFQKKKEREREFYCFFFIATSFICKMYVAQFHHSL